MTRAPFASRSRPPNGANFINQLLGASAGAAFLAVCLWLFDLWVLCEVLWALCEDVFAVAAWAASTEATTGAIAIKAPRPIARYLLIIAFSF
jgi:hypothetical protein